MRNVHIFMCVYAFVYAHKNTIRGQRAPEGQEVETLQLFPILCATASQLGC